MTEVSCETLQRSVISIDEHRSVKFVRVCSDSFSTEESAGEDSTSWTWTMWHPSETPDAVQRIYTQTRTQQRWRGTQEPRCVCILNKPSLCFRFFSQIIYFCNLTSSVSVSLSHLSVCRASVFSSGETIRAHEEDREKRWIRQNRCSQTTGVTVTHTHVYKRSSCGCVCI